MLHPEFSLLTGPLRSLTVTVRLCPGALRWASAVLHAGPQALGCVLCPEPVPS